MDGEGATILLSNVDEQIGGSDSDGGSLQGEESE